MKRTSAIALGIVSTVGAAVVAFGIWHHIANQHADRLAYQQWRNAILLAEGSIMPPRHVPHYVPNFSNLAQAARLVSYGEGILSGLADQQARSMAVHTLSSVGFSVNRLFDQATSDPIGAREKWSVLLQSLRKVNTMLPAHWAQMQTLVGNTRALQLDTELQKIPPI